MLKCDKVEMIRVGYADLEAFIEEVYGREFILEGEECSSDSSITYSLTQEQTTHQCDIDKIESWKNGSYEPYMTRLLMQDMVNNGLIEPGNYIIDAYW